MKIVIDIAENIKKQIDDGKGETEFRIPLWLAYSISKGMVLPEGHGDLKDVQDIINRINLNYNNHQSIDAYSLKDMIAAVPTIIKADKDGGGV